MHTILTPGKGHVDGYILLKQWNFSELAATKPVFKIRKWISSFLTFHQLEVCSQKRNDICQSSYWNSTVGRPSANRSTQYVNAIENDFITEPCHYCTETEEETSEESAQIKPSNLQNDLKVRPSWHT